MQEKKISITETCYNGIKQLSNEQQLVLYKAIFEYGFDGIKNDLSGIEQVIFELAKKTIDIGSIRSSVSKGHKGGNQYTNGYKKQNTVEDEKINKDDNPLWIKFRDTYPRPNQKTETQDLFLSLQEYEQNKAIDMIDKWNKSEERIKDGGRFIKGSLKYLQEKLYNREPKPFDRNYLKIGDIDPIDGHKITKYDFDSGRVRDNNKKIYKEKTYF